LDPSVFQHVASGSDDNLELFLVFDDALDSLYYMEKIERLFQNNESRGSVLSQHLLFGGTEESRDKYLLAQPVYGPTNKAKFTIKY
jgi:hypothetical protein